MNENIHTPIAINKNVCIIYLFIAIVCMDIRLNAFVWQSAGDKMCLFSQEVHCCLAIRKRCARSAADIRMYVYEANRQCVQPEVKYATHLWRKLADATTWNLCALFFY